MTCNDIASILDNHRGTRLAPAERATVDAHLVACTDCAAAWHGHSELLALRVPPMPAALLERALLASRSPRSAEPRRARLGLVIASALLAGAAFAGITIMSRTTSTLPPSQPPATAEPNPAQVDFVDEVLQQLEGPPSTVQGDGVTSVELVETALSLAPIVRWPPDYPPDARERRLEGRVRVKFDVTAAGLVENISVVESSDPLFEEPAIRAVSRWRYLPRILAGKRVATKDIRTAIQWAYEEPPPDQREAEARQESAMRGLAALAADLGIALDRLAADDLRGAELQLDQMLAVYPEAGFFHRDIWSVYGYLFTVQGSYDRAIDAYETALAAHARNGTPQPISPPLAQVPLANLYFARHQYDMALKTLLRPNLPGGSRLLSPDARVLAEKLQALGISAEPLQ